MDAGETRSRPTVWFREFNEEPIPEQEPLSGFLIQFSLFEASMGAEYLALPRKLTAPQVEQLTEALHLVPLRPSGPGHLPTSMWPPASSCMSATRTAKHSMPGQVPPTEAPWARWPTSSAIGWNRFDG
ncbi:hypothetical protein [Streptomyces sp. NBC_00690]|uniref:hypothetical protein n=1 Tax=Streptomyces sp. NBC_00690 TaxID=2975808 RepID=UPI002E2D0E1F|nr:hypothetical protein [Streptomyces sp. NBC_00690]